MIKDILSDTEERMKKTIEHLRKDLASLRAGRANPAMLEKIMVDYYGQPTPINQLANITVPEARLLVIQPWDKTIIASIEKAIMKSDLGINPSNDGNVIRLVIPQLTEERRKELVKVLRKRAEEARVAVRNIRRDSNELLKSGEKEKLISEDDNKKGMDDIQKETDRHIKEIDSILQGKEKEIMEV
ncbi:ribosome recycling factor [Syntrophomonas wolfei]|uniref:Ribosome-recycling factor n=1 Tax=Syntrophomonas wolfei subsp. wolfei (strain DSM 2245B / Goettingen) TaxID=335541 RepID=RRF_SYNWW|nr:ribosome recycling factor [Syntrophomonas wolfei]Q0AYK1.1 RecName: Full=Ribosome-recycling factor; Short=RRF; AltName: Full=Ribosome-releasing factor [Syntrophomonas wolfei subsp. wolfei str. Goettingen G311]ABI68203.1 ribosome recycling factor [Syntrophomonas wolfei subsp. wolfei str. Goettingen G311]